MTRSTTFFSPALVRRCAHFIVLSALVACASSSASPPKPGGKGFVEALAHEDAGAPDAAP